MHGRVWGHLQRRPRRPCPRGAEGWRQGCPSAHQAAIAPGFVKGFLPSLGLGTASRLQLSRGHSHSEWSDSPSLWTGLGSQSPQERSSLNSRSRAVRQIPLTPRHDRIPAGWKTRGRLHCSCGKSRSARAMRARPASVLAEAPRHQGRLGLQSSSQLPLIPLSHSQIASTQTALPCAPRLGLERRQWPCVHWTPRLSTALTLELGGLPGKPTETQSCLWLPGARPSSSLAVLSERRLQSPLAGFITEKEMQIGPPLPLGRPGSPTGRPWEQKVGGR